MAYRQDRQDSTLSKLSKGLALLSLQLLILTILLHRFASLGTPAAMNLFLACLVGGGLAVLLAIASWIMIWNNGDKGALRAAVGVLVSLVIFAYPAWILPQVMALPLIHDVTTDPESPPVFRKLATERVPGSNSIRYPGADSAKEQAAAYPDIQPIFLERSNTEAFEIVQEAVQRLKWKIALQESPNDKGAPGRIEAVDKTLVLGLVDDIAIRVKGTETGSRIDVRSASRYGKHDLGRNAARIRDLVTELKATLVEGERAAAAKREAKLKAEKKKKAERERRHRSRKAYRARPKKRRVRVRKKKQLWPF